MAEERLALHEPIFFAAVLAQAPIFDPVAHREVRTIDGAHAPDFTILRLYLSARALATR